MRLPPESLRAFPPGGAQRQWPGQARSTAFAGTACSAAIGLPGADSLLMVSGERRG